LVWRDAHHSVEQHHQQQRQVVHLKSSL
jgi:hypothetical protein